MYDIGGGRMNIVKGVADLIQMTSGYGGDFDVGSPSHRFLFRLQKFNSGNFQYFDFNTVCIYEHGKCINRL